MSGDRVTYNEPDNWLGPDYALGMVDEVVVHDALVHFEMLSDTSGYLMAQGTHRYVFVRFHARPTTRAERRQILASTDGRLRDHLCGLIPKALGGRSLWIIPAHRRPAAVLRDWWSDRRAAGAVLYADVEEDMQCGGPEATP